MWNRRFAFWIGSIAAAAVCTGNAAAQEVVFTGESCPLTLIRNVAAYESGDYTVEYRTGRDAEEAGEETNEEETEAFEPAEEEAAAPVQEAPLPDVVICSVDALEALGVVNDLYLSVELENQMTGLLSLEEVQEKIPALQAALLDSVQDWTDFGRGSGGERAMAVQQALSDLKLLEGGVDGAFGGGTESSVMAFQKRMKLEETGIVDAATWFLLMDAAEGKKAAEEPLVTAYPPVYTVEEKYAAICGAMEDASVLENFLDPEWKFTYDVFEGTGRISWTRDGIFLGSADTGDTDIDRMHLDADLHVDVHRTEEGQVNVTPVLEVNSIGASRPYIQGAVLKSGSNVIDLECVFSEGGLSGIDSTECSQLEFPEEAAALLQGGDAELTLRLSGLHQDYDLDLTDFRQSMLAFAQAYAPEQADAGADGEAEEEELLAEDEAMSELPEEEEDLEESLEEAGEEEPETEEE